MPVTINCDMGEGFGIYRFGDDESCMPFITHANIACGFHASDPQVMWRTVRLAKKYGIKVGAHPGFNDREGFGRREIRMGREEVAATILYQVGALKTFLDVEGMALSHVKPHGALFGLAMKDEAIANGIADAMLALGVPVIGFANCVQEEVYRARGVPHVCEFYADLDYDDRGWQIITMKHEAVEPEAVARKVRRAVEEGLTTSINGKDVRVRADSVCVHSDTPDAVAVARAVHETLEPQLVERLM